MTSLKKFLYPLIVSTLLVALIAPAPILASAKSATSDVQNLTKPTRFFTPRPLDGAFKQIAQLISSHDYADAELVAMMIATPQAVWFTSGTPDSVRHDVRSTVRQAVAFGTVPILVAYNIPGRDCAQYSAGGAATGDDYKAWIDSFAAGLDNCRPS